MAWVQLASGEKLTEDELKAFCKDKIAHLKVTRYVRFVTEFPMTVTGKIRKVEMREQSIAELGLQDVGATETA